MSGRRVGKIVDGLESRFLYAGDMEIAEYDAAGTVLRRYIPGGAIDSRVAYIEGAGTSLSDFKYYHADRLGNVAALSDAAGNVSDRYAYDPFGNEVTGAGLGGQLFRYTGRKFDPETGLYFYRARYYDPDLGRFLSTDPIGYADQWNLYTYVHNDPVNGTDPTGMDCEMWGTCPPGHGTEAGHSVNYCETSSCSSDQIDAADAERTAFRENYGLWGQAGMLPSENFDGLNGAGALALSDDQRAQLVREALTNTAITVGLSALGGRLGGAPKGMPVPSGLPRNIHAGAQGKHIVGHNNYIAGRSPLASNVNPQTLLDGVHAGQYSIIRVAGNKPVVNFRQTIGYVDDQATQYGIVHYGRNGAHIVPANPVQK